MRRRCLLAGVAGLSAGALAGCLGGRTTPGGGTTPGGTPTAVGDCRGTAAGTPVDRTPTYTPDDDAYQEVYVTGVDGDGRTDLTISNQGTERHEMTLRLTRIATGRVIYEYTVTLEGMNDPTLDETPERGVADETNNDEFIRRFEPFRVPCAPPGAYHATALLADGRHDTATVSLDSERSLAGQTSLDVEVSPMDELSVVRTTTHGGY